MAKKDNKRVVTGIVLDTNQNSVGSIVEGKVYNSSKVETSESIGFIEGGLAYLNSVQGQPGVYLGRARMFSELTEQAQITTD